MASNGLGFNTLPQKCRDAAIEIFISPMIIEEMCQSPPNIIDSAVKVIKKCKLSPVLRHPNEIEVNELLTAISHSCPDLISKGSTFNCSIFGDGNSQSDKDWQGLLKYGASFISSDAIQKITKNKLINSYYQNLLKHNNFLFEEDCGVLSIDEAAAKINKISQLWIQPEKLSIEDLKNEIKKVKQKPLNPMIAKWTEYGEIKKGEIIAKFCKSQVVSEYFLPIYNKQVYRSAKVDYFLQEFTIRDVNDALRLINCLCDKIDYKKIPSLWIPLTVAILQETQKIQESNVYDQMHAIYLKEVDYFVTCDKTYAEILCSPLMREYLKTIQSKGNVAYITPKDVSEKNILSAIVTRKEQI